MKYSCDTPLTRRAWMVLTGAAVTGCGGGGSSLALPGTGGTGAVFAQGTISGFGSVIVNGIKFDDLQAKVTVEGITATPADLRLGMVVEIQGERGADLTLGTANNIEVWSIAQGEVSALVAGGFVVSGMTILCDVATVLDGVNSLGELAVGQTLAVWGLQKRVDAAQWRATRVTLKAPGMPVVSSGLVQSTQTGLVLNAMSLQGVAMDNMMNGALVRVEGVLSNAGVLQVSKSRLMNLGSMSQSLDRVEVQGYVTEMTTARRFRLGMTDVDATGADMQQAISLVVGDRAEVYGNWRSGVLVATQVAVETENELQSTEITGTVSAFTSLVNFVVREQRCDASQAVFSRGVATDLKLGVLIKVKGTQSGSILNVTSVEYEN
ncbi:MAG: hypothetical protein RJB64_698 [Pseudomonadota bacterium]|jgi:hypothetical protein